MDSDTSYRINMENGSVKNGVIENGVISGKEKKNGIVKRASTKAPKE